MQTGEEIESQHHHHAQSLSMRTDGYVVSLLAALASATRGVLVAAAPAIGVAVVLVVRVHRLVLLLVLRHAAVSPERPEPELALHQRRVAVQRCVCDTIRYLAVSTLKQKLGFGWRDLVGVVRVEKYSKAKALLKTQMSSRVLRRLHGLLDLKFALPWNKVAI